MEYAQFAYTPRFQSRVRTLFRVVKQLAGERKTRNQSNRSYPFRGNGITRVR